MSGDRPDFSRRSDTPELMDTETCTPEDYASCLADLSTVNRLTLAYRPTLSFLDRLRRAGKFPAGQVVRILDVGAGYGDMLHRIGNWAARHKIAVDLTALDLKPPAIRVKTDWPIRWVAADIFAYQPEPPPDIVLSALFTHHLTDDQVAGFLGWMDRHSRIGWFVNDLERQYLPYAVFRLWSRLAGWHRFVQHDGPVSISRAFRRADWQRLVAASGLSLRDIALLRYIPFRLCLARVKP